MGRNSLRIDIAKKVIKKHFGEFDPNDLLHSDNLLELALNCLFCENFYLEITGVKIICGFIVLECVDADILVIPYLDYKRQPSLYPDGRKCDIPTEDVIDIFKAILKEKKKRGQVVSVRLFSHPGVIRKDTDECFSRRPVHFLNRFFYYNSKYEHFNYVS